MAYVTVWLNAAAAESAWHLFRMLKYLQNPVWTFSALGHH